MRQHDVICLLVSLLFILSGPTNASVLTKLQPRQDVPSHPETISINSQHINFTGDDTYTRTPTWVTDRYTERSSSCAYPQDTLGPNFGNISIWSAETNYQNNQDCEWQLVTPPGTVVEVTWLNFDLESSSTCSYDYVEIEDLSSSGVILERYKYCGSTLPPVFNSSSNMLVIRFHSDSSLTWRGFSLYYSSYTMLESASGNISVGSADTNYQNNQDHEWRLLTPSESIIEVTWLTFDLENCVLCSCDSVEIQDFSSSGVALERYKYCGSCLPPVFTSSSNMLVIRFHSDSSVTKQGFSLHYTSYTVVNASQGTINVGSTSGHYLNNQNYEWRLVTPPDTNVRIAWLRFDLEQSVFCLYDSVEILEVSHWGTKLKGRYCGRSLPPPVVTSSNVAVVKFRSDGSGVQPGFTLLYDSAPANHANGDHPHCQPLPTPAWERIFTAPSPYFSDKLPLVGSSSSMKRLDEVNDELAGPSPQLPDSKKEEAMLLAMMREVVAP